MIRKIIVTTAMAVGLACAAGASLDAHDFWIEPRTFIVHANALVGLRLMVGQAMLGDALGREDAGIDRFFVRHGNDERAIPGRDGGEPAGVLRVSDTGLMVVAYESRPHSVELPRATFDTYLGEEGLDAVQTILARMPQRPAVAREQYSRCAKAILNSGAPVASEHDRPLGLTLELIAARNPYTASAGQDFPITLLYKGVPQAGALVIALNRDEPQARLAARSDAQGRVSFRLPRGGMWLIKSVHMIPAAPGGSADWTSFWASLTFELPNG